jgi:hypothetical protein
MTLILHCTASTSATKTQKKSIQKTSQGLQVDSSHPEQHSAQHDPTLATIRSMSQKLDEATRSQPQAPSKSALSSPPCDCACALTCTSNPSAFNTSCCSSVSSSSLNVIFGPVNHFRAST